MSITTLSPIKTLKHAHMVWHAAFSPDGTKIVTASGWEPSGKLRIWTHTGEPLTKSLAHGVLTGHAAFSHDQTCIVSCDKDHTARLWSAVDGKPLFSPLEHRKEVWHAAFHPTKPWLATASEDGTVRLWDWTTGEPLGEPLTHPRDVCSVEFNQDGSRLLAHVAGKRIALWNLKRKVPTCVFLEHPRRVRLSVFSPDGLRVLTGCDDRRLRLWTARTGRLAKELFEIDKGSISGACFTRQGDGLFIVADFASIKEAWGDVIRFDCPSRTVIYRHRVHTERIASCLLSSDEQFLLTTSLDDSARLLDAKTGDTIAVMPHKHAVKGASFNPRNNIVLTWDAKTAHLWDVSKNAKSQTPG